MSKSSQRNAYGAELLAICKENENVVALDADLCGGTQSIQVQQGKPESFYEMGIGEQNMITIAAGLALAGKIPVAHSFAVFIGGRSFEQIRQGVCLPKLNVNIVGASCGVSDFADGATHQAIEDVAVMRVLPHMTIFSPADAEEARKAIRAAVNLDGPCYIRINRNEIPDVTTRDTPMEIGKPHVMAGGKDVAICASGHMVALSLEARQILAGKGVDARVINFATIKPLDPAAVRAAVGPCPRILTVEEHSVIGGLGSAVLEALADNPIPLRRHGVKDVFGESAEKYDRILAKHGLTAERIAEEALVK
ncbi:MAG: transketolase family protein [Planctomycetota bacterium]|jgi:transketolase|nr:transketolase family protein [Planctomycetota bacterium]